MQVLQPGRTCWRIEQADQVALIVDAADYFRAARSAMLKAQHSILMIGWDFDTRIELDPTDGTGGYPDRLGAFLTWLADTRPGLHINILEEGVPVGVAPAWKMVNRTGSSDAVHYGQITRPAGSPRASTKRHCRGGRSRSP